MRNLWRDLLFRRMAASSKPILVGPWRSEVGFETLYWLPWLSKWRETWKIPRERLVAISRGGASAWYDAGQQVELYDYAPVASVRQAMLADAAQTGSVKQMGFTRQERVLLPMLAHDLGIDSYFVLHPQVMYRALAPWWDGQMGLLPLMQQIQFDPLSVGHPPLDLPLPEKFIAVSFYARHTWTMDEERKDWVSALVEGLAKILPVVLIESGLHADEHIAFPVKGPNILSTASYCHATNNLAIQAAVLNRAQAFVGTYGGLMQLAVRLKKPSVGFYTHFAGTAYAHKALTEWLGVQQQTPVFIGRPDDAKFVQEALQVAYIPPPIQRGSSVTAAVKG